MFHPRYLRVSITYVYGKENNHGDITVAPFVG